jgi:hypothetical protein
MSNPVGRPPWIPSDENIKQVHKYASLGLTQQQIADCLGISINTYCEKKHEFPEFNEAIKRGMSKGIANVAESLVENATTGNVSAQIFYLKARAKWSDNAAIDDLHAKIDKVMEKMGEKSNGREMDSENAHEKGRTT